MQYRASAKHSATATSALIRIHFRVRIDRSQAPARAGASALRCVAPFPSRGLRTGLKPIQLQTGTASNSSQSTEMIPAECFPGRLRVGFHRLSVDDIHSLPFCSNGLRQVAREVA